jgi:hypothetical protein
MMEQLQQELVEKKEAPTKLQVVFQEHQKIRPLSIATSQASTMIDTILVRSY